MRKLVSIVLLLFSAGVYAFGDLVDNSIHQSQGQAQGQDQDQNQHQSNSVGNGIGNFSPEAEAAAFAKQLQLQGNVGLGSGNDTSISISGKNDVDAQPAIAPAIAPGDPTAPCFVTYGGSAAGGGVAALGFSGYKYDPVCGALEFYRTVGADASHSKQAHKAVDVAYHSLMNSFYSDMGETEYNKATGTVKAEGTGTTASYTYPIQDGSFMKVSFTKLGGISQDLDEGKAERNIAQSIRD